MAVPLDPQQLTPAASLNRVKIVDLPGVALEPHVKGKTAYELLSARALIDDLLRYADALGLSAAERGDPARLPLLCDRCFAADEPRIRATADMIAQRFGRHLGYLILTLKRGDAVNRAARDDWDESYWAHWSRVRRIWLCGGLVGGRLGARMLPHAAGLLGAAGLADCALEIAAAPALLPLIGAARSVPPGERCALILDFGQSYIKRALARYAGGTLVALRLLSALPTPWPPGQPMDDATADQLQALLESMAEVLAESWRAVHARGDEPAPLLVASLASYVAANQPLPRQGGIYAQLHTITDNLGRWLADEVGRRLGRVIGVALLHDGTAAARAYAGAPDAAVITLGTSLGVGFPPPADLLRPVVARLEIDSL